MTPLDNLLPAFPSLTAWLWHASPAVVLPGLVTLWALACHRSRLTCPVWVLVVTSTIATALTAWYAPSTQSVHMSSAFFVSLAMLNYLGFVMPAGLAYGLTFLTLAACDVGSALRFVPDIAWPDILLGIGGAGFTDTLFLVPLAAAALQAYVTKRRPGGVRSIS